MTAVLNYNSFSLSMIDQQNQRMISEKQVSLQERLPLTRSAAAVLVKTQMMQRIQTKSPLRVKLGSQSKSKKRGLKVQRHKASTSKDDYSKKSASQSMNLQGSDIKDCQKSRQKDERRTLFRYSEPSFTIPPTSNFSYFQSQINKQYLPNVTTEHIAQIDSLIDMTNPIADEPINESVQAMFRLRAQEVLHTLTPIIKEDGEVVSVLVRKPKISAMLYFKKQELTETGGFQGDRLDEALFSSNLLQLNRVEYVDSEDAQQMEKRTVFRKNLDMAVEIFKQNSAQQPQALSQLSEQLMFLRHYLQYKHTRNTESILSLRHTMAQEMQNPTILPNLSQIYNSYTESVLRKNILRGLQDFKIDVLNYFKLRASLEQHRHFIPNKNVGDLREFINKKKVKRNKKTKTPLATCCMGCFSSTSEDINEIKSCYQCGSRAHRICREISDHPCTICQSRRTKKIRIKECVICPNRGVLFKKLGSYNLHVFCLLVFNMFYVENCAVVVDPDLSKTKPSQNICDCCNSNSGILVRCQESDSYLHPLCAFLAGYFMTMDTDKGVIINTRFYSPEELSLVKFNRLYRANMHKFAYRFTSYEDYLFKTQKKRKGNSRSVKIEEEDEENFESINKDIHEEAVASFESLISSAHNNLH